MQIPPREQMARHLLLQNFVTGCALIGNAALRSKASPVPAAAMMHDWWLALVAASMGELIDVPVPLVLYRLHGGNTVGVRPGSLWDHAARLAARPRDGALHARQWVRGASRQSAAFAQTFQDSLPAETFRLHADFGRIEEMGFARRKLFPLRSRARTNSLARVAAATIFSCSGQKLV